MAETLFGMTRGDETLTALLRRLCELRSEAATLITAGLAAGLPHGEPSVAQEGRGDGAEVDGGSE